jgi:two-component system chemotaxis sensor kinase CheA
MDMSQYLEIFIEETKEHLQSLNQCLLQMEKNPQDNSMLNEIFRVAHTLKGMSGTMGFNRMSRLTHDMEDVLQALRSNEMKVSPELIDLLFKCLDALESYTTVIVETGSEGTEDNAAIINALAEMIRKKGSVSAPAVAAAAPAPASTSRKKHSTKWWRALPITPGRSSSDPAWILARRWDHSSAMSKWRASPAIFNPA